MGDEIVLPSTSHRHSQNESEVRVISGVSANGLTLTLCDPLNYKHVSIEHTFADGSTITLRGEVGLLSHNVKVQGAVNAEWSESIPACEAGFDTGNVSCVTYSIVSGFFVLLFCSVIKNSNIFIFFD